MNEKQLKTINENNMKVIAVLQAVSEALAGASEFDLTSLVDIAQDYCNSTANVLSEVI